MISQVKAVFGKQRGRPRSRSGLAILEQEGSWDVCKTSGFVW